MEHNSCQTQELGPKVCSNTFFLHAILGCDTTSQLYGIGKATSLKKFKSSRQRSSSVVGIFKSKQGVLLQYQLRTLEDITAVG